MLLLILLACSIIIFDADTSFSFFLLFIYLSKAHKMNINSIYINALLYINVALSYFTLQNLFSLSFFFIEFSAVTDTFSREQISLSQNVNFFCNFKLNQHAAILNSVAVVYFNSVKTKHYYLTLNAIADFVYFSMFQKLRVKA